MSELDNSSVCRSLEEARSAKKVAQVAFERLGKIAGIGITRSGEGYGLKVNVLRGFPSNQETPKEIQGVPVRIEVVGPIKKRMS